MRGPERLPATARDLLHQRMQRHGDAMNGLVWSVVLLNYDLAAARAQEIADEPRLARPLQQDASELNSQLPEGFFEAQDKLAREAKEVATVARRRDATALSTAASQLMAACMGCHAAYLEAPPPSPEP